jgi:amino acid transporter
VDAKQLRKKHDQELIELLNELRVVLPGVQVLFAFLLVAPFNARFDVTGADEVAYLVALSATAVGSILLIAPSAYHRLRWRERNKERMLRTSNRLAIAGLAAVAVGMTSAMFLVTDVLLDTAGAVAFSAVAAVFFTMAWFVFPLLQPYDRWDETDEAD